LLIESPPGAILQSKIITQQSKLGARFHTDWLLLAGFCAFFFFYGLGYFGLVGADEPRYAQIAREMLARGDWITPILGGKSWLEKPPLYYWQAMLAYSIFGVSDWAARLPSAVDATLMVLAIYFFLRKFRPGLHLDGALMTASAAGVIGFARAASTDMPLAAMFTIAMLAWYGWYEHGQRTYLGVSYVFIALAMLAKGPIAPFLAMVMIALFAAVKKDYSLLRRTLWIPGIGLFCVVALPWFVAVQIKNPEFFRVFILQHNLARFGSNLYHHKEPFWYFVPVTLLALIPWVVLCGASFVQTVARLREKLQPEESLDVFLFIWLLVPVIFFSISQSKLPGYILPAVPAGTLLVAEYVRRQLQDNDRPRAAVVVLHSIVAAAPLVPALMIQYLVLQHRLPWGRAAAISLGFALTLAIGLALSLLSRVGWGGLRFSLVPVALGVAAILRLGAPSLDATLSARPVANEISALERTRLPLAVFHVPRDLGFGLAFYRNQIIERYEVGEIPSTEHLLVAPEGSQMEIAQQVQGRRVSYLGSFAPQGLDYYWVAGKSR
jgi:4-amino-4-deoxy-L-arabinose transferase-like glycosyltransferase